MEDACNTMEHQVCVDICKYNYDKHEIISACVSTFDAITEKIRQIDKQEVTK